MMVIGYAKAGHENDVAEAVCDLGMAAVVPQTLEPVSRGKSRRPKLEDRPALPNYVFVDLHPADYTRLLDVKHLARSLLIVPTCEEANLRRWIRRVQDEAARILARHAAGDEVSLYTRGEKLDVRSGPFMSWLEGRDVTFRRMVKAAKWPAVEAETEMMGRIVKIQLDPLDVRKQGANT